MDGEDGSVAQAQRICAALGKLIARGSEVGHVDRLAIDNGPPVSPGSAESPSDDVLRDRPVMSPENQPFVLTQEYPRVVRIAQPRRRFDQRIEHRLEVKGRAADHLEHVGGGGLLLQRLRKVLSCFGEFAGPLVEFPLEIPRGTAIALGLRRIAAAL